MAGTVTGMVQIKVDGALYRSLPGARLKMGGVERELVQGGAGWYGPKETKVGSELECKFADMADTDAVAINAIVDKVGEFIPDSGGKKYIIPGLCSAEPCEQTDGEVTARFIGKPAIKA